MEFDTSAFSRPPLQTIFQQNHFVPQILILRMVWIQPDKDIGEKGGQTESDKRRAHGESQTRITKVKMTRRRDPIKISKLFSLGSTMHCKQIAFLMQILFYSDLT